MKTITLFCALAIVLFTACQKEQFTPYYTYEVTNAAPASTVIASDIDTVTITGAWYFKDVVDNYPQGVDNLSLECSDTTATLKITVWQTETVWTAHVGKEKINFHL